jgi:hypothetical protein
MKAVLSVFATRAALVMLAFGWLQSCKYYEPVLKSDYNNDPAMWTDLKGKTLVVHGKKGIYMLAQPSVDSGRQAFTGQLSSVPPEHNTYIHNTKHTHRYKPATSKVLSEVHLYTPIDTIQAKDSVVTIPLSSVERMEIIKPDKAKNTLSVVGWALLAWVVIATVIVVLNPPASL